jgi:hypothetical protein
VKNKNNTRRSPKRRSKRKKKRVYRTDTAIHTGHSVVASTGCKIYGEGEWEVRQLRQHGIFKRRTWRKLHVAVDEASGQRSQADLRCG